MQTELDKYSDDENVEGDEVLFRGDGDTYRHACRACDVFKKAHMLLLMSIEDWCGGLELYCYNCATTPDVDTGHIRFTGSEKLFEKSAKKMWRNRAIDKCGKEQRHQHEHGGKHHHGGEDEMDQRRIGKIIIHGCPPQSRLWLH